MSSTLTVALCINSPVGSVHFYRRQGLTQTSGNSWSSEQSSHLVREFVSSYVTCSCKVDGKHGKRLHQNIPTSFCYYRLNEIYFFLIFLSLSKRSLKKTSCIFAGIIKSLILLFNFRDQLKCLNIFI